MALSAPGKAHAVNGAVNLYVPTNVASDSSFPFGGGEETEVEILEPAAVLIYRGDLGDEQLHKILQQYLNHDTK